MERNRRSRMSEPAADGPPPSYEHLDAALEALSDYGPTLRDGLFNHAPMVAEALCAMGYAERAMPWIGAYRPLLVPRPRGVAPFNGADWPPALGDSARFADWATYFRHAFDSDDWRQVLDRWVVRLAPGLTTAACHGAIRTAHAARALGYRETEARLRELGDGLAAWASQYRELPVAVLASRGELAPSDALRALTASARRPPPASGSIDAGLAALRGDGAFAGAVARADLSGRAVEHGDDHVIKLTEACLAAYRRHPDEVLLETPARALALIPVPGHSPPLAV